MCTICGGVGFITRDVAMSHPQFGKAIPCTCQADKIKQNAQRKLEALDGLTTSERAHRFEQTKPTTAQYFAREALTQANVGLLTLQGDPGTGKSHFLHCVVNQAREQGRVAVYATMPDVLDYLRAAFNPKNDAPFEERWKLLIECEVLCLDELDEFNATDWARERFLRLIDERWRKRDELLTVAALNGSIDSLPGKVASRLLSGRVLHMRGADMRQVFKEMVPA